MAEHPLTLPAIVARIVKGGQMMMDGFIELNTSFFDVLLEKIMNAEELYAFVSIPLLQTKPGRIVSVPSFG
jgi:hypothetical protein